MKFGSLCLCPLVSICASSSLIESLSLLFTFLKTRLIAIITFLTFRFVQFFKFWLTPKASTSDELNKWERHHLRHFFIHFVARRLVSLLESVVVDEMSVTCKLYYLKISLVYWNQTWKMRAISSYYTSGLKNTNSKIIHGYFHQHQWNWL